MHRTQQIAKKFDPIEVYLDPAIKLLKDKFYGGRIPLRKELEFAMDWPSQVLSCELRSRDFNGFARYLEFTVSVEYANTFRERVTATIAAYGTAEREMVRSWYPPPKEGDNPDDHFPSWPKYEPSSGYTMKAFDLFYDAVDSVRELHGYLGQMRAMLLTRRADRINVESKRTADIKGAVLGLLAKARRAPAKKRKDAGEPEIRLTKAENAALDALAAEGGNKTAAARSLHISRGAIRDRLDAARTKLRAVPGEAARVSVQARQFYEDDRGQVTDEDTRLG